MDRITPQIAIGNFLDATSLTVLSRVDAKLCLRPDCSCVSTSEMDVLCLPLVDGPGNRPGTIERALQFIEDVIRSDQRILVHCHAGRSRSVVIVARHLMRSRGITSTAALAFMATKREIYLSPCIEDAL